MKTLIKYTIVLGIFFGMLSCSDFVEGYDESPNSPTKVTPAMLLSSSQLGLQVSYTSGIIRTTSVLVQQIAGTKDQMLDAASYSIREGDNINEWNTIYNNVVQPANDIIVANEATNPYYSGMAKVVKAMGLGLATAAWGDVPATEAGLGIISGNKAPKFDTQQAVYVYLISLLNEANTLLSKPAADNVTVPATDDFFYGGDVAKWKNLIVWLKARYENHLSKKDAAGSATKVLALLGNDVAGVKDLGNLEAKYGEGGSEINQWFAFENSRADYIKAGAKLVDLLKAKNDPRLAFYFSKGTNADYLGSTPNEPLEPLSALSVVGPYIAGKTSSIPIVTYAEALFIQAEAALRANNKDLAAKAYNAAVKAAVKQVTGADAEAAYVTAEASETITTITLEKIMVQKYIALFINIEAWTDYRRTGLPTLVRNTNGDVAGIPQRFPTVIDERKYNPNAIVVSDILKKIWIAE
jgi:hypothetical protein